MARFGEGHCDAGFVSKIWKSKVMSCTERVLQVIRGRKSISSEEYILHHE